MQKPYAILVRFYISDASGQDFLQNTLPDIVFLWFHVVEEVFGYSWM